MYSFQPNEQVPYWPQESSRHYGDGSTSERSSAAHLESIHARLTQLTQRRTAILATRNHQLANRQREDIDFHRVAQSLEAEEFSLRNSWEQFQRASSKFHEARAATPMFSQPTPPPHASLGIESVSPECVNHENTLEYNHRPQSSSPTTEILQHSPSHLLSSSQSFSPKYRAVAHSAVAGTSLSNSNVFSAREDGPCGKRHGRPIGSDSKGRPLWKRKSDGNLVYVACPVQGCGKADFETLHGLMCHLKAKHKNRKRPERSKLLDICGTVFTQNPSLSAMAGLHGVCQEDKRNTTQQREAAVFPDEDRGVEDGLKMAAQSEEADRADEKKAVGQSKDERPVTPPGKQSIASIMN